MAQLSSYFLDHVDLKWITKTALPRIYKEQSTHSKASTANYWLLTFLSWNKIFSEHANIISFNFPAVRKKIRRALSILQAFFFSFYPNIKESGGWSPHPYRQQSKHVTRSNNPTAVHTGTKRLHTDTGTSQQSAAIIQLCYIFLTFTYDTLDFYLWYINY